MARAQAKTIDQVEADMANEAPKKEEKKKRELQVLRDDYGLYYVKQDGGGKIPEIWLMI